MIQKRSVNSNPIPHHIKTKFFPQYIKLSTRSKQHNRNILHHHKNKHSDCPKLSLKSNFFWFQLTKTTSPSGYEQSAKGAVEGPVRLVGQFSPHLPGSRFGQGGHCRVLRQVSTLKSWGTVRHLFAFFCPLFCALAEDVWRILIAATIHHQVFLRRPPFLFFFLRLC